MIIAPKNYGTKINGSIIKTKLLQELALENRTEQQKSKSRLSIETSFERTVVEEVPNLRKIAGPRRKYAPSAPSYERLNCYF